MLHELQALAGGHFPVDRAQLAVQVGHAHGFRPYGKLTRLNLGEVQDLVDDAKQCMGLAADGVHGIPLVGFESAQFQQFQHAQYAVHGRADFVAHRRQESALGAIGGIGGVLGACQCVGQVAL